MSRLNITKTWQTRLLPISVALGMILMISCPNKTMGDDLDAGMNAYKQKDYTEALNDLSRAAKENQNNASAVFYLGLARIHTGDYIGARQAFEQVTRMLPADDPMAMKAQNNIIYIDNSLAEAHSASMGIAADEPMAINSTSSSYGRDNYLSHVITNGQILHFDPMMMPLRVYISDGKDVPDWSPNDQQAINKAMQAWSSATNGRLTFITDNTSVDANIIVDWQNTIHDGRLGETHLPTQKDIVVQSEIVMGVHFPGSDRTLTMAELDRVALHEFGHALGMTGHSPNPRDAMYYFDNPANGNGSLTARDINTIQILYLPMGNTVQSTGLMTAGETTQYYDLLQHADTLQQAGHDDQAIADYQSAIAINNKDWEPKFILGILLTNQGVRAFKSHDTTQARQNWETASSLFKEVLMAPDAPPQTKSDATRNIAIDANNMGFLR